MSLVTVLREGILARGGGAGSTSTVSGKEKKGPAS